MTLEQEMIERRMKVEMSGVVRIARTAFFYLAAVFAICVIIQIFLAGLSTFVSPIHWANHISFVHTFEFVPLLMLLLSFAARLPKAMRWQCVGLVGLIAVQYFTGNIRDKLPWVAAIHPVSAMVIFWIAITLLQNARKQAFLS